MTRTTKIRLGKLGVAIAVVPVTLWAWKAGPPAHKTGVTGTGEGTCADVGCHVGTSVNGGGGTLTVTNSTADTYTPGQTQTFTINVPTRNGGVYGFELTVRPVSDRRNSTGTLVPDSRQWVQCASASAVSDEGSDRPRTGCPGNRPVEFIQQLSPYSTGTIAVQWTAPSASVGDVEVWVSANSANNNGDEGGDRIYNTHITLRAASANTGPKPTITDFVNGATFNAGSADGSWGTIRGTNLSPQNPTGRVWTGADFSGVNLPKALDGVSVTVDGKPAYIYYISDVQLNFQVPDTGKTGNVIVTVTTANGTSDNFTAQIAKYSPGLFMFSPQGNKYPASVFADGVFVGPSDLFGGAVATRPAKPGEIISLYGTGFGPTNPGVQAGIIQGVLESVDNVTITIGGVSATAKAYVISPGLYQINATIPASLADGDQPLVLSVGGVQTPSGIMVAVKR